MITLLFWFNDYMEIHTVIMLIILKVIPVISGWTAHHGPVSFIQDYPPMGLINENINTHS
jgi:hypothetical protein